MLIVCASSTDADLASTGDVMVLVYGATTTDAVQSTAEIEHLGRLVRRASRWAEGLLGRPLAVQTYQETVAGFGTPYLMLSRYPIRAVLRLFDATATGQATEILSSDYRIEDADAGLLGRDRGFDWTEAQAGGVTQFSLGLTAYHQPGAELRPWLVEYVAGYLPLGGLDTGSPNWTTAAPEGTSTGISTLPDDIRHAIAVRAAELVANPMGVTMRQVGDLRVEYASAGPAGARRTSAAEDMLAPYVRAG